MCSPVYEDNDIIVYMGYFGFNLDGLFEYSKQKSLTPISIENFAIYDGAVYEDIDEPIIILEVNPDFINTGDNFSFCKKSNFFIISGQRKFFKEIDKSKKGTINVFLFTMEETLPYLIKHRKSFVDYWNDKLDTYLNYVKIEKSRQLTLEKIFKEEKSYI